MKGKLAIPTAGHDKGLLHVVVGAGEQDVFLCNGKQRPLDRPKRKNRKHVFVLDQTSGYYEDCLRGQKQLTDKGLRRELNRLQELLNQGG